MSLMQVGIRVRSRRYGRQEDARMMGYPPAQEDERIERLASAWRNELEASPAFLALAIAYVLDGGSSTPFWIICMVFVAARYSQAWAQFTLRQPHRIVAFLVGFAASISMALLVIGHSFGEWQ
jgi:uncharacterized membrane protein YecN with MAPEG domain